MKSTNGIKILFSNSIGMLDNMSKYAVHFDLSREIKIMFFKNCIYKNFQ